MIKEKIHEFIFGILDATQEAILDNHIVKVFEFGYYNGKHSFVMAALGADLLQLSRNEDGSIKNTDYGLRYKTIMTHIVQSN